MNRTVSPNVKFSQLSTVTTKVLPPNLSTVLTISSSQKLSYSPVLKYANNSGISSNIIGVLPRNYPTTYFVFFGDDFVQTATQIKIQKSALLGLTLTNNNRAESLFVGLLARLINYTASDTVGNVTANLWGLISPRISELPQ